MNGEELRKALYEEKDIVNRIRMARQNIDKLLAWQASSLLFDCLKEIQQLEAQLKEHEWISVEEKPEIGKPVLCEFEHWYSKNKYYQVLVYVNEDDCSWRVFDIGYMDEMSHDYNITKWQNITPPQ